LSQIAVEPHERRECLREGKRERGTSGGEGGGRQRTEWPKDWSRQEEEKGSLELGLSCLAEERIWHRD